MPGLERYVAHGRQNISDNFGTVGTIRKCRSWRLQTHGMPRIGQPSWQDRIDGLNHSCRQVAHTRWWVGSPYLWMGWSWITSSIEFYRLRLSFYSQLFVSFPDLFLWDWGNTGGDKNIKEQSAAAQMSNIALRFRIVRVKTSFN